MNRKYRDLQGPNSVILPNQNSQTEPKSPIFKIQKDFHLTKGPSIFAKFDRFSAQGFCQVFHLKSLTFDSLHQKRNKMTVA